MALFIPVAIGLAGPRINVLVNTILITPLKQGSVSWLNYAYRLMQLPLGLFGVAVGTVTLQSLSRLVVVNDTAAVRSRLFDSMKMALFLTVPTSILIAFLSRPLTRVIYQHGRFRPEDTLPRPPWPSSSIRSGSRSSPASGTWPRSSTPTRTPAGPCSPAWPRSA